MRHKKETTDRHILHIRRRLVITWSQEDIEKVTRHKNHELSKSTILELNADDLSLLVRTDTFSSRMTLRIRENRVPCLFEAGVARELPPNCVDGA